MRHSTNSMQLTRRLALAGCVCLAAWLAVGASANSYGQDQEQGLAASSYSLAPNYESELLAAAYNQQHEPAPYQASCVITIKPYNSTASSSYSSALAATSNSYLTDYVSR